MPPRHRRYHWQRPVFAFFSLRQSGTTTALNRTCMMVPSALWLLLAVATPTESAAPPPIPQQRLMLTQQCLLSPEEVQTYWNRALNLAEKVHPGASSMAMPDALLIELPGIFPCEGEGTRNNSKCLGWFNHPDSGPAVIMFTHKQHNSLVHEFVHLILWQLNDDRWRCSLHIKDWERGCSAF